LSRHEGGFFEKCPIYIAKKHHLDKKKLGKGGKDGNLLAKK
jgi:hypothetical protein